MLRDVERHWCRPLAAVTLPVYRAIFHAQLDDALDRIRDALSRWTAVYVQVDAGGPTFRGPSREEMRSLLLERVFPLGAEHDPEVAACEGDPPPRTILTLMPHEIVPRRARILEGWTYLPPEITHGRMNRFVARAGPYAALFDAPAGAVLLHEWTGRLSPAALERSLRTAGTATTSVTLYDGEFGQTAEISILSRGLDSFLHALERKSDWLCFDDDLRWYLYFRRDGSLKVVTLE